MYLNFNKIGQQTHALMCKYFTSTWVHEWMMKNRLTCCLGHPILFTCFNFAQLFWGNNGIVECVFAEMSFFEKGL